jgi:hypothetical protein
VLYFFARLRIDLQIGIFGIIAQDSDFPEMTLQNCKSDMTTPLKQKSIFDIPNVFHNKIKYYFKPSIVIYLISIGRKSLKIGKLTTRGHVKLKSFVFETNSFSNINNNLVQHDFFTKKYFFWILLFLPFWVLLLTHQYN